MAFRRPAGRSLALVVSTICALVALFALAGNGGAATRTGGTGTDPWIASELPDYAPGSTVNLLGGSWQPGEAVHVNVNDNDGQTWSRDVDVTADPNGDISDSFSLPNWFVAQYTVTATGASGTATTTFTDGNLTVRLATADQASPAPSSISFTYTTFNQDSSCATTGTTQTTASQAPPFNVGIGGGNNSARAVNAAASGYTFAYFSSSATSTTPLTGSQLCYSNQGDVYAHFTLATRSTATSLTSNTNPSTFGQSVTFTATVTAPAGNPGANGSVTFKDGASTITGCSAVALNASGQATCASSALDAAGSPHSVTAVYSGASSGGTTWNGSTSSALSQAVSKASSTTTVSCTAGLFVYDGAAKTPCSATVTGAGGLSQSLSVSYSGNLHAGSASASAGYAGDANHDGSNDSKTFTIAKRDVTASITAAGKTYDGSDLASLSGCTLEAASGNHGVVSGDAVGCTASNGRFADANAGSGKAVSADVALSGTAKDDYQLTGGTASTSADIGKADLDISAVGDSKPYDGGTSSSGTPTVSGLQGADTVTGKLQAFESRNVLGPNGSTLVVTAYTVHDGNSGDNYDVHTHAAAGTITAKGLTISGALAVDKTYDATDTATVDWSGASLDGVVSGDDVAIDHGAYAAHFASRHVGTDKPVDVGGVTLGGGDAGNYTVGQPSGLAADIGKADLEISAVADSKTYDGGTSSSGTPTVSGLQGSDTVTGKTQAFQSKNVLGAGNSVLAVTGYTVGDGNSGDDYAVHTHTAAGTISAAALHISAVGDSKTYDGNTGSSGTPTVTGLKGSDTVTGRTQAFQSKDVLGPNGSTLVVTGYTVNDGNAGGNYAVTAHTATGTITKKGLTVSGITAGNKVWDGTTTASPSLGGAALVGVISPDEVALNAAAAVATFANPGVGTWTVTISGLTLSGSASGNYSLTQPATTASILPWNAAGRGFYAPVGADAAHTLFTAAPGITPTVKPSTMEWNSAKGGSTVPLKFNVFAGSVEKTTADAFPGANPATAFSAAKLNVCTDATSEDPVDFTTTGSTSLRYDATAGQWIQNWKTPNVSGDSCYRAWVTLADGSTLEAFFKLKK